MAPYCTIPRDYLSDTPLLRAMGFLVSQHGQLGAIPPPQKGYLSDTCAIPYKNKATGCDTPLCDTISKGYCAIGGGVSRTGPLSFCNAPSLDIVEFAFFRLRRTVLDCWGPQGERLFELMSDSSLTPVAGKSFRKASGEQKADELKQNPRDTTQR